MLKAVGKAIKMDYRDFGLELPMRISGGDIKSTDIIKLTIKTDNEEIVKEYTNLTQEDGKFVFVFFLNKEESERLEEGEYEYGLKQYRDGEFRNTILKTAPFKVEKGV